MESSTPTPDERDAAPTYEAPAVKDYGSLADITAGSSAGNFLDRNFPVNTPARDLTFS
jgi:hypothetical protein